MDIHRCRFIPYPASAINAVAFSHSGVRGQQPNVKVRLAIGRANGNIEIWNPSNGMWHQEVVIPGGQDRSIDGLVWATGKAETIADGQIIEGRSRLFSIGYTAAVTEWDLEKGIAKKHASGQHGDIWCLAELPVEGEGNETTGAKLMGGTVDGSLVLYNIENDDLSFQRVVCKSTKKKSKMVSIAFQSRRIAVVGCSDSTIRVHDAKTGQMLRQMTLGPDLSGGARDIIVWSVKCLPNGDIVSGDSTGQVRIWDKKTYTQVQRIQSHTQDVLSLAISTDGSKIVSGGMDKRTVLYEPMVSENGRWAKAWHRKYHRHDVKAMASFEGQGISVVVSGGPDASPVVAPLQAAGQENHRTLPELPQAAPLLSAPRARYVASWWDRTIHIWHIARTASDLLHGAGVDADETKNRKLLAKMLVKSESNITSATISEDGTLLIVGTASELKAFRLEMKEGNKGKRVEITKINVGASNKGSSKVWVSPDKQWLSWIQEGSQVHMARIKYSSAEGYSIPTSFRLHRLRRSIPKHTLLGGLGTYDRSVTQIAFSADSKMLAVGDLAGYVDTWIVRELIADNGASAEGDETSLDDSSDEGDATDAQAWVRNPKASLLPKSKSAIAVLSFSPDLPRSGLNKERDDYTLLVIPAKLNLLLFHPLAGSLSNWSRRNKFPNLPEPLRLTRDVLKGVIWQGPRIWVYGVSLLAMLDVSVDLASPTAVKSANGTLTNGTKRRRPTENGTGAGNKMTKREALIPSSVRTAVRPDGTEWADVEMDDGKSSIGRMEDNDDDGEDTDGGELQALRDADGDVEGRKKKGTIWWHTFKYRPVLGIVSLQGEPERPLKKGSEESGRDINPLEVCLVERPLWEQDLPDRFLAQGEWER